MSRPPTLTRLLPGSATPGYGWDNGSLLDLVIQGLPADLLQPVAATSRDLCAAASGVEPEECLMPQVPYDAALKSGNLPALRRYWRNAPAPEHTDGDLVKYGHLAALQWLLQYHDPSLQLYSICTNAARNGRLAVLQWARSLDPPYPWNEYTCSAAAGKGHLGVLQWARANGCPWNDDTCAQAAWGGHLETLQWARANECPWTEDTCAWAATNGHLDVLQWARANGCPWSEDAIAFADEEGHAEVAQWLRDAG